MQYDELKAILASVHYLAIEAKKEGFGEVHLMLKRVIAEIDAFIKGSRENLADIDERLLDSDLYTIMEIMSRVRKSDKFDLQALLDALETCEGVPDRVH
jgi:hypothetical protein